MSEQKPNADIPAFPHGDPVSGGHSGMSLRDWFAGMAMQAILKATVLSSPSRIDIASDAYAMADAMADAMIAERKKAAP